MDQRKTHLFGTLAPSESCEVKWAKKPRKYWRESTFIHASLSYI